MARSSLGRLTLPATLLAFAAATSAVAAQGKGDIVCIIHPLGELADDPSFAQWIAEIIPDVVEPGTWRNGDGRRCVAHYHPAMKGLVVGNTKEVHAKVEILLKDLKKSMARQPASNPTPIAHDRVIAPASFTVPAAAPAPGIAPANKRTYLVPAPAQQPKHLFHLILRYEGEGVLDTAVVDSLKQLTGSTGSQTEQTEQQVAKPATTKPAQVGQVFNFILRYEGEGIIDANVVEVIKEYIRQAAQGGSDAPANATPPALPVFDGPPASPSPAAPASYDGPPMPPASGPTNIPPTLPAAQATTIPLARTVPATRFSGPVTVPATPPSAVPTLPSQLTTAP